MSPLSFTGCLPQQRRDGIKLTLPQGRLLIKREGISHEADSFEEADCIVDGLAVSVCGIRRPVRDVDNGALAFGEINSDFHPHEFIANQCTDEAAASLHGESLR